MKTTAEIDIFLEDLIEKLNNSPFESMDSEYANSFKNVITNLERSKREFHSNLFLILSFGPVKSGKSTLINLIAREEELSPTKFGVECTMRPSIIIKTKNKPCIKRYISKTGTFNEQKEKANFHLVLDYIRGLSTLDRVKEEIIVEEHELTLEKIEKFVAGNSVDYTDLGVEPIITVIEVEAKDSKIIDERTALVDVPGLDGALSNWRKSAVHDWILTRSDFLLFVQSSMAALNSETINFLKEVYINSKEPPMQLVQNIVEAKHWRGKEYLFAEAKEQRDKGIAQILDIIPYSKNNEFDSSEINLGITHDYIFKKQAFDEEVLNTSGFLGFEEKLYNILELRREDIQLKNSIKGLINTFNDILKEFDNMSISINKSKEKIDADYEHFNKISEKSALMMQNSEPYSIYNSVYREDRLNYTQYLDFVMSNYRSQSESIINNHFEKISKDDSDWKNTLKNTNDFIINDLEQSLYTYNSEASIELINKINFMLYKNIENNLFSGEDNIEELLKKVRSENIIRPMSYTELIKKENFGVVFEGFDIKKEPEPKKDKLLTLAVNIPKTIDEYQKTIIQANNQFIDGILKENVRKFIENRVKESNTTLKKDIRNVRESFEIKIKKSRDANNNIERIIEYYTPVFEDQISALRG